MSRTAMKSTEPSSPDVYTDNIEQLRTEKQRVEKELEALKTGFQGLLNILDEAGVMVCVGNPETKAGVFASRSVRKALGMEYPSENGALCHQILYGSDTPCHDCRWERILTDDDSKHRTTRVLPDNTVLDGVAGSVAWPGGFVARVEVLKPRHEAMGTDGLVQSVPFPCVSVDTAGVISAANMQACRLLGYEPHECTGRPLGEMCAPEEQTRFTDYLASLCAHASGMHMIELTMQRKDGIAVRVRLDGTVSEHRNGAAVSLCLAIVDLTGQVMMESILKNSIEKLNQTISGAVLTIAKLVEMKDPYTAGHQKRVADLSFAIARRLGLSEEQCECVRMAGILHDVGKVGVPIEILSKPGAISIEEFGMIRAHAQIGHDILKEMQFPGAIPEIVLQHHERNDGSGYPYGLSGDQILLEARILAVADVVEAMSSHRPYRPALGLDRALDEIVKHKKVRYDPFVVDACLEVFLDDTNAFPELRTSSHTAAQQHSALFGNDANRGRSA